MTIDESNSFVRIVKRQHHGIGMLVDHGLVQNAVVGALYARYGTATRERPGTADGVDDGLGARIGKAHKLHGGNAVAQHTCQAHLRLGRTRKGRALLQLAAHRLHDVRVPVAVDQ
jgi:hypothetical protein